MSGGRPTIYSDELAEDICGRLAEGESLRAVCEDETMPSKSTVLRWVVEDRQGFSDHYAKARMVQAYTWADEILEIADDGTNDTYRTERGEQTNHDVIQRSRLRVDTRKWLLSKVLPKVYGKRQKIEHSGPAGGPIEVNDGLSDDERAARVAAVLDRARARRDRQPDPADSEDVS